MAIATAVTIGTSNKVTVDYQSQEVSISVTYELERGDADLQAFVTDKAAEVERAHSAVWRRIREIRAEQKAQQASANGAPAGEARPAPQAENPAANPDPKTGPDTGADDDGSDPFEEPAPRLECNGKRPENGAAQPGSPEPPTAVGAAEKNGAAAATQAVTAPVAPSAGGNGNGALSQASGNGHGQSDGAASLAQQRAILSLASRAGLNDRTFAALLQESAGKTTVELLTRQEAARLLVEMQRRDRTAAYPAA